MMSSDGYDGTVEVLGWSCFTAVPSNVANEAVRTLPEATMAKEELKTTGERSKKNIFKLLFFFC